MRSFDVGIHDVFENGAVAGTFFTFSSSQNSGNSLLFELADLKFDSEINKSKESERLPKDGIMYTFPAKTGASRRYTDFLLKTGASRPF